MEASKILPFPGHRLGSAPDQTETVSTSNPAIYNAIKKNAEDNPNYTAEAKTQILSALDNTFALQKAVADAPARATLPNSTVMSGNMNLFPTEDSDMNTDDILKSYMDKIDRDQAELRQDIRHQEERMDTRLNRIEDMISKLNDNIDSKMEQIRTESSANIAQLRNDMNSNKGLANASFYAVIGVCVATIIGVAALVVTFILNWSS